MGLILCLVIRENSLSSTHPQHSKREQDMSSNQTKSNAGNCEGEEDELAVLIYKSSKTAKLRAELAAAAAAREEKMHVSSASGTSTRKRTVLIRDNTSKKSTVSCKSSTRKRKPSSTEVKGEAKKSWQRRKAQKDLHCRRMYKHNGQRRSVL